MTPPPTSNARHVTDPTASNNRRLLTLGHATKALGAAVTTTAVPWHIMLALGGSPADLGLMAVGCASCAALGLAAGAATAVVIAGVIVCNVIIAVFASSSIITHLQTTQHGEALTQAVLGMRAISYSAACIGPLAIGFLADHCGIRTCCVAAGLTTAAVIHGITYTNRLWPVSQTDRSPD